MKHRITTLWLALLLALPWIASPQVSYAQTDGIEFSITYDSNTGVYDVYMRPNVTPASPNETTTSQVTIKVPHATGGDRFVPQPSPLIVPGLYLGEKTGPSWALGSRVDAPTDDAVQTQPYDYISFDLTIGANAGAFAWAAGTEVRVFSFANTGTCQGAVTLVENSDPFVPPPANSVGTNPGNQIAVRGIGTTTDNDYIGTYGGPANCGAADSIAPSPPQIDPISVATDPITGSSEPGATISLTGATCTNAPVVANAAGEWSCDLASPLSAGTVVTATAADPAGNSSQPASTTVSDASTQSSAPTIAPVSNGDTEVSGAAAPGALIDLSGSSPALTCTNAPVVADFSGHWRCTLTSPVSTGDTVSATSTEPGKTISPASTTTVTDPAATAPAPPTVDPTDGSPVTGTTIAGGDVQVLDPATGALLCSTTADGSGNFSCDPLSPAPTNGQPLNVVVTDPSSGSSNPATVVVDQVAPSPPLIDPVDDTTDPITGLSEPGALISVAGATCTNAPVTANALGEWSCDLAAPLPAGTVVSATATDPAGNTSQPASTTVSDAPTQSSAPTLNPLNSGSTQVSGTAAPGAVIDLSGSSPALTCSNAPVAADASGNWSCALSSPVSTGDTVSATATEPGKTTSPASVTTVSDPATTAPAPPVVNPTDGDPVTGTTVPNGAIAVIDPNTGAVLCTTVADGSGNFSCSSLAPAPTDGQELAVVAIDPTNGGVSLPALVTVDQTAPAPPTIDPIDDTTDPITGVSEPGATVTVTGATCTNAPVVANAAGEWSCDLALPLAAGTVVTATAADPAGNSSQPASTTVSDAPTQSSAPTLAPVSSGDTTISGTAAPDAVISLAGSSPALTCTNAPVTADANGAWSCVLSSPVSTGGTVSATTTEPGKTTSPASTTAVTDPAVTAPAPPMVNPTGGDPITGSTIPNGLVQVVDPASGAVLCTTAADTAGAFSCSPVSPAPTNGQQLNVIVTDPSSGNTSNPTVVTVGAADSDGDGVSDAEEDAAPNNGDGNGDGTLDRLQGNVASITSNDGFTSVTAEVTGACNDIAAVNRTTESAQASQDAFDYPYGLMAIELTCQSPGQSATVKYYWHVVSDLTGLPYRKYGPMTPGGSSDVWYDFPVTYGTASPAGVSIATSTIVLTDGAQGDDTGVDGVIIDPSGPANTTQKSTLGDWVWFDINGNGVKDAGEQGINDVIVNLYLDTGDGIPQANELVTTTTTVNDGSLVNELLIDSDDANTGQPGAYDFQVLDNQVYIVEIDPANFLPGGALENYIYTGENAANAYNGPNPRVVLIGVQQDYNDADFPFMLPASAAVDKTLNTVNTVVRPGNTVSFTIRITNTGQITITDLPLVDRYNSAFLQFDSGNGGNNPAPDSMIAGELTWNNAAPAGGLAPQASVSVDVYFTAMADTTLLVAALPCTTAGEAPNIAEVMDAVADPDGSGAQPGMAVTDATDCASVRIEQPTAVNLTNTGVSQTADGVLVQWSTTTELDIVGFRVLHSNGVTVNQVDPAFVRAASRADMIPAKNAGQSSGASYSVLDAGATLTHGDAYVLETVHSDGSVERNVLGVLAEMPVYLPLVLK
ncbi:MAG: Ig-like domain-containing protein [Caldilineaceae bacterium]